MDRQQWSTRWGNPAFAPGWWLEGPHPLIKQAVESGWLQPCRLLEVGCGSGQQAAWLQQRGFDVTAFDFSPEAIELAKARQAGPQFLVSDVTAQGQLSGTFDAIVDVGCFHGLRTAHSAYVSNILRWSKLGTKFALVTRCGELQPDQRLRQVSGMFFGGFSLHAWASERGTLPKMPDMEMMIFRLVRTR